MDRDLIDLVRRDRRYPVEAYEFIVESIPYTQERLGRLPHEDDDDPEADYHVDPDDVCRGACELAKEQFGLMADVVFRRWNIRTTGDIGAIVFNLIEIQRLFGSERDDPAEFEDLFNLPALLGDVRPWSGHSTPRKAAR